MTHEDMKAPWRLTPSLTDVQEALQRAGPGATLAEVQMAGSITGVTIPQSTLGPARHRQLVRDLENHLAALPAHPFCFSGPKYDPDTQKFEIGLRVMGTFRQLADAFALRSPMIFFMDRKFQAKVGRTTV